MAHRTPGTNPIASRWPALATGRGSAWVVALVPLLLGLAVIGALGDGHRDRLPTDQLPAGYDSTAAVELAERLPDAGTSTAIVVFSTGPADDGVALSQEQLGELGRVVADLSGDEEPVLVPSEDGTAALGILTLQAASASEVAAEVSDLRQELATQLPDGVVAQVTGPAGIEADLAAVFDGANVRLLAVTALVVAVLLVVTYRSPVVWIVPLLVVGIADQTAARLATRLLA
ncbi:MAG: MMPL family transporter, partial [Salana multivorans]|nr:MMPL family transporter [Salana multivorans]